MRQAYYERVKKNNDNVRWVDLPKPISKLRRPRTAWADNIVTETIRQPDLLGCARHCAGIRLIESFRI